MRNILKKFKQEWGYLIRIYKLSKNEEAINILNKNKIYVDWIGRPYKFVNIKEEFHNQSDVVDRILIYESREMGKLLANEGYKNFLNLYPSYIYDPFKKRGLIILTPDILFVRNFLLVLFALITIILFIIFLTI